MLRHGETGEADEGVRSGRTPRPPRRNRERHEALAAPRRRVRPIIGLGARPRAPLEPGDPRTGSLLVCEGVIHHLGEVGVTHQLRQLPDVPRVGLQEPRPERAPEVVGLYVLLLYAALPHPGVEPSPQGVLANPSALLIEEEVGNPSGEGHLCGYDELVADLQVPLQRAIELGAHGNDPLLVALAPGDPDPLLAPDEGQVLEREGGGLLYPEARVDHRREGGVVAGRQRDGKRPTPLLANGRDPCAFVWLVRYFSTDGREQDVGLALGKVAPLGRPLVEANLVEVGQRVWQPHPP